MNDSLLDQIKKRGLPLLRDLEKIKKCTRITCNFSVLCEIFKHSATYKTTSQNILMTTPAKIVTDSNSYAEIIAT